MIGRRDFLKSIAVGLSALGLKAKPPTIQPAGEIASLKNIEPVHWNEKGTVRAVAGKSINTGDVVCMGVDGRIYPHTGHNPAIGILAKNTIAGDVVTLSIQEKLYG
jgi:hypothetical protein